MPPIVHELKTVQPHFDDVWHGRKTAELRLDDRGFRAGDFMDLREYDAESGSYGNRMIHCRITHIISGYSALKDGYVMLSFVRLWRQEGEQVGA